jgi:hypothetical protein
MVQLATVSAVAGVHHCCFRTLKPPERRKPTDPLPALLSEQTRTHYLQGIGSSASCRPIE